MLKNLVQTLLHSEHFESVCTIVSVEKKNEVFERYSLE